MRQTKKIILISFLCAILFIVYLYLIIQPQIYKKQSLKENMKACELEIEKQQQSLSLTNKIDEEYTKKNIEVTYLKKKFFESIHQENIIVLLDDMLRDLTIEISSIDFSELRKEDSLDVITVTLPFYSTYEDLMLFLKRIRKYDRKIIVSALNIDNMENQELRGSIILAFYSLHTEHNKDDFFTNFYTDQNIKQNPFSCFGEYDKNLTTNYTEELPINPENISETLLYGFESSNTFFVGFPKKIKGKLYKDSKSKEGNYSRRLEYDFLRSRKNSQGNIVLAEEKIFIEKQLENIGLWVYTSEKSNHKIGIVVIDRNGKNYNIQLSSQINWTGWKHLKGTIPLEISYPIKLQRIYVESLDFDKKIKGTLKFDQLEAIYATKEN